MVTKEDYCLLTILESYQIEAVGEVNGSLIVKQKKYILSTINGYELV